jgi:hypothetical protein
MSNDATDFETQRSVVAIAKVDNRLMTVELRKQNGAFEVLWTKSSESTDTNWWQFATQCGLTVEPKAQTDAKSDRMIVVGFSSAAMAFYRISVPAVGQEELEAVVKLQAEARLPLPAEQMELAWRSGRMHNGNISITVAAARKEQLQGFVENVRSVGPAKILLDCEGIVRAWRVFFSNNEEDAVVVSIGTRNTQVCLAEDGQLTNAVVLDMGMEDFTTDQEDEQTEATERFAQDLTSVLELFGSEKVAEVPVFVLSDGSAAYVSIVSSLRLSGLNARVALPDVTKLTTWSEPGVEDIYKYRAPIGLALIALEARADELNIFERLYSPVRKKVKRHWVYSPKITGAIAAVMLVLLIIVSYAVVVASPGAIERRLEAAGSDIDIDLLMQRQKLIKTVASQRPDLLDLLNKITTSGVRGIKLESFHFKKGQRVSISGQASNNDQLYNFEKSLQDSKNIDEVRRTANRDAKTKKLKFTITFHYRNFTK